MLRLEVISVVVPLYNEQENVPAFVERLEQVLTRLGHPWELVFALDPCTDGTRETILEFIDNGYPIRLLTFSRRIGKPLSLLAGLEHSRGDACVVMDVDLQDPPELIEQMVETMANVASRSSLLSGFLARGKAFWYLRGS
jgi:glycosyltransferase involved in cell wall biosynthesis